MRMQKIVFSSDQLPAHLDDQARFRLWRDIFTAEFGSGELEHEEGRPFFARNEFVPLGDVGVASCATNMRRFLRTAQHVARDGRDELLIGVCHNQRPQLAWQRGRELVLQQGAAFIAAIGEPQDTITQGDLSWTAVSVPSARLRALVPDFEQRIGFLLDGQAPAARHLGRYAAWLLTLPDFDDASLATHVADHLVDLAALALGARGDVAELAQMRGLRAARVREIVAEVNAHFAEPNFSQADVAKKLGLSIRYVQDLLQETGASFSERVMELRLQKARAMLSSRQCDRMRINEIALACGFYDASHFTRSFRRRFGASPIQFRGSAS